MNKLIELCEHWMESKIITGKEIKIDDSCCTIFIDTKIEMKIEFSLYLPQLADNEKKEFLTLINNLIKYNVESNLPF